MFRYCKAWDVHNIFWKFSKWEEKMDPDQKQPSAGVLLKHCLEKLGKFHKKYLHWSPIFGNYFRPGSVILLKIVVCIGSFPSYCVTFFRTTFRFSTSEENRGETFRSLLVARYFLLVTFCSLLSVRCSLLFARCSLLFTRCSTRNSEGFFFKVNKKFSILICVKTLICE